MGEGVDTRLRILEASEQLFRQFGLRSVSMDDIATKMGISKKTIYQVYADKDELVVAVITAIISNNQNKCESDCNCAANAVHEIFLAIDLVRELFRSMNPSLLFDMQKYHPTAFRIFLKHKHDYLFGIIRQNIVRGIEEELYRSEVNVDVIARFRVECIVLPFNSDFHTNVKANLAQIEEEITIHYLFGLVSPKGYKLSLKYLEERSKKLLADGKR